MTSRILVEMILNITSGINLLFIFALIIVKEVRNERVRKLLTASGLHFFSIIMKIANLILEHNEVEQVVPSFVIMAAVLDIASFVTIIFSIFSTADGKITIRMWKERFFPGMLAAITMPFLTALAFEIIFSGFHFIEFGYGISLCVLYIIFQREEELRLLEKEKEISATYAKILTDQIQPHFIFNALMSIEDLCYNDPEKAAKCIEDFSGYLRGNIDALTTEGLIPFEQELKHIRQYEALEHARTGLDFSMEYKLNVTDFQIPALTVQPVVENAIKHGALSRRDGTGMVVLTTGRVGDFVRITVEDNGIGTELTEKQEGHKSIGIRNVQERLSSQCGGSFELTTTGEGSRVLIVIPLKADA